MSYPIGSRIYVKTILFEGWAKVVGIASDDFLPIEIELEDGDDVGHKYKRVGMGDIIETIREEGD